MKHFNKIMKYNGVLLLQSMLDLANNACLEADEKDCHILKAEDY